MSAVKLSKIAIAALAVWALCGALALHMDAVESARCEAAYAEFESARAQALRDIREREAM